MTDNLCPDCVKEVAFEERSKYAINIRATSSGYCREHRSARQKKYNKSYNEKKRAKRITEDFMSLPYEMVARQIAEQGLPQFHRPPATPEEMDREADLLAHRFDDLDH